MIVIVGELMWDVHVEAGESLETGELLRRVPGGAAANVAMDLARREYPAAVAGVVSDDALGQGLCSTLEAKGVDTTYVLRTQGRTGVVFLERTEAANERFVSYRPTVEPFTGCEVPRGLRALHIAALNPNASELLAFAALAEQARDAGAWVLIDANARPLPWRDPLDEDGRRALERLVRSAHAIKASDGDLERIGQALPDVSECLMAGGATLFVTRGAKPTEVRGPWGSLARKPPSVTLMRSIGAGDAFCAGLLSALYAHAGGNVGRSPEAFWSDALTAAEKAASLRVSTAW